MQHLQSEKEMSHGPGRPRNPLQGWESVSGDGQHVSEWRRTMLRGCSAEVVVLPWPTVLCAGHRKKTARETTWMQAALDQQLRNEPLLRPRSCLGDGDESLFLSGTQIINNATSRFNANIYMAPIKCQVHARRGVLAGSL